MGHRDPSCQKSARTSPGRRQDARRWRGRWSAAPHPTVPGRRPSDARGEYDEEVIDLLVQLDVAISLVVAAVLGAAIGAEREIHGHPAGMRTHLLVCVGSALFTGLSIHAFGASTTPGAPDPARVAAQIVAGIGFLGAGAIIKDGPSIRGLTTAASLWATAAIGMGAGAGVYIVSAVAAAIVVFSLWPLNRIAERLNRADKATMQIRVALEHLDALGEISAILTSKRMELLGVRTERVGKGRYEADFEVRIRQGANVVAALELIARIPGVELASSDSVE